MKFIIAYILFLTSLYSLEINARGATFPKEVYSEWINAYEKETGIKINYEPTGSGDGIISAVKHSSDFSGTDKPLQPWRLKRYKLKMFPVIVGSIVLSYNIPGISDNELKLSEEAIAAIFSGNTKFWDDPIILKDNPTLTLPHKQIVVAVRSDESGTTYNMTYYLRKIDYEHFKKADKTFDWQCKSISAIGNSGIAKQIVDTPYCIGYIDYSNKLKYKLDSAAIQNRDGKWILPTLQSASFGAQNAKLDKEDHFYGTLAYQEGKSSYPIIATTFILISDKTSKTNTEIIKFFNWAFKNGEYIANKHGFAMLPNDLIRDIKAYWKEKSI